MTYNAGMIGILLSSIFMATVCLQDTKPNIVWLSVEDMSPWLGCYGDDTVPTPNIDRLAARGTRYTNCFATTPVCAPSRSTLITGRYATTSGALHMRNVNRSGAGLERDPNAYDGIPIYQATPHPDVRCFPEILRNHGYWCTNAAKQDYQFQVPPTVWNQSGGKAHWRNRPDKSQPFFAVFNHTGTHESGTFPNRKPNPKVADPTKVSVPPYYPDTPAVRKDIARTYDNIARMDAWVGSHIAELEKAGELDNTIIFFFSDHGVGLPRGKRSIYDSGTRVPLIVCHPDQEAKTSERVVSFVDFPPTTLSLADIDPPTWMQGHAFDGPFEDEPRTHAFIHADRMDSVKDRTRSVTDGRYRYVRNFHPDRPRLYFVAYSDNIAMMADIRALAESGEGTPEQWQIVDPTKPDEELYDSLNDPHEVRNRIDDPQLAEIRDRLKNALAEWQENTGDLGGIPEDQLVRERIWPPDGVQPTTADVVASLNQDGAIELSSATPGASIGWRPAGAKGWRVYQKPLSPQNGEAMEAVAHRIGFKRSKIERIGPSPAFSVQTINAGSNFEACGVADFDNDGDLDIVCGDTWYAAPDWTPHSISLIRSIGGYRVDFADVPMDVNNDGWMDVVSCSWHDRGVFWRENPGTPGGTWKTHPVDLPGNMETAIAADVDGDGRMDFVPNCVNRTVWYRMTKNGLIRRTVDDKRGGHGVGVGDVNGDGRSDLLGPDGWYEARADDTWTFHPEWTLGGAGISIIAHDFNGDDLPDLFWGMGHDYGLYWLEQGRDADGKRTWTRHTVDESWSQAHGLVLTDLDQDGTPEVLTGKRRFAHNGKDPGGNEELLVCTYHFDADRGAFVKTMLSKGGKVGAGHYPVVIDIDADGDLDLVTPGKSGLHLLKRN